MRRGFTNSYSIRDCLWRILQGGAVIALPQATGVHLDSYLRESPEIALREAVFIRSVHGPRPPLYSETFEHPDVAARNHSADR